MSPNIHSTDGRNWLIDSFQASCNGMIAAPLKGPIGCCLRG